MLPEGMETRLCVCQCVCDKELHRPHSHSQTLEGANSQWGLVSVVVCGYLQCFTVTSKLPDNYNKTKHFNGIFNRINRLKSFKASNSNANSYFKSSTF